MRERGKNGRGKIRAAMQVQQRPKPVSRAGLELGGFFQAPITGTQNVSACISSHLSIKKDGQPRWRGTFLERESSVIHQSAVLPKAGRMSGWVLRGFGGSATVSTILHPMYRHCPLGSYNKFNLPEKASQGFWLFSFPWESQKRKVNGINYLILKPVSGLQLMFIFCLLYYPF